MSKSQIVLYLALELINGKILSKKDLTKEFEVSSKTISRYIGEINVFFSNFYLPYYIQYCQSSNGYRLFSTKLDIKKEGERRGGKSKKD